jgi:hypothetical protein
MARVGRLAGALLAETGGAYYLVGNPKVPCDWRACGFEPPGELDARVRPVVRLAPVATPALAAASKPSLGMPKPSLGMSKPSLGMPQLSLEVEGEALARLLVDTFVIPRTGSVSERLWRLVLGETDEDSAEDGDHPLRAVVPARWLGELPPAIWNIVRDTVLRCT